MSFSTLLLALLAVIVWRRFPPTFALLKLTEDGVSLRRLWGRRFLPWHAIEDVTVRRHLELRGAGIVMRIPRRHRVYPILWAELRRRRLVRAPKQLRWNTIPTSLLYVGVGVALITWAWMQPTEDAVTRLAIATNYFLGTLFIPYGVLSWARWQADATGVRWSNWFWSADYPVDAIVGVTSWKRCLLGWPKCGLLLERHSLFYRGVGISRPEAPAELLQEVVGRALRKPLFGFGLPRTAEAPRDGRWWIVFIMIVVAAMGPAIPVFIIDPHPILIVYVICMIAGARLLIPDLIWRFRPEGLWRLTWRGSWKLEPADSFVGRRHDMFMLKDGRKLRISSPSWVTRNWLVNPIHTLASYRDPALATSLVNLRIDAPLFAVSLDTALHASPRNLISG